MSKTFCSVERRQIQAGSDRLGWACVGNSPAVNLSEVNTATLLRLLGYDDLAADPDGGLIEAGELVARCRRELMRLEAAPNRDLGSEWVDTRGRGGCQWIEGGRSAGYLTHRLSAILEVAVFAAAHSFTVSVG